MGHLVSTDAVFLACLCARSSAGFAGAICGGRSRKGAKPPSESKPWNW